MPLPDGNQCNFYFGIFKTIGSFSFLKMCRYQGLNLFPFSNLVADMQYKIVITIYKLMGL